MLYPSSTGEVGRSVSKLQGVGESKGPILFCKLLFCPNYSAVKGHWECGIQVVRRKSNFGECHWERRRDTVNDLWLSSDY